MKKILLLLQVFILSVQFSNSQTPGEWTWMSGANTTNSPGVFGIQGMPSPLNTPPALYEVCDWVDKNGNLWFFGGYDYMSTDRNDLWKYDPLSFQWTWMKGSGTSGHQAVYGVKGVPSPLNTPGGRAWGAWSFVDNNNNLWMYGGIGYDVNGGYECMSDLWRYNISTNEWTWMQGPDSNTVAPVFGTKGVLNPSNSPGARAEADASWTDLNNNLWLFGGALYVPINGGWQLNGFGNDLWKYDMSTNSWAWMKGSNVKDQLAIYGTKTTPGINNTPSSRGTYTKWTDVSGDLWMFGGYNFFQGSFNDVWRFNVVSNMWTWMGGTNQVNNKGFTNGKCNTGASNAPSARYENRASSVDACGKFWTMGGSSVTSSGTGNDLWKFDPISLQWTWEAGDTAATPIPVYGTKGVSSPLNVPGGKMGAGGWMDKNGNFWVFGGLNSIWVWTNDMWRFVPDSACGGCINAALPVANFISSDTTFCDEGGKCISFTDHSSGNPTSWKWLFPGAQPDSSTQQNPTNICYNTPGTYSVTLIVANAAGNDTIAVSPMITFGSGATAPVITLVGGDTLVCSAATSYQWYFNGTPIPGATNSFYVAVNSGTYNVYITDSLGCSRLGNGITFTTANEIGRQEGEINIFPNPAGDWFEVSGLRFEVDNRIDIYNVLGENVFGKNLRATNINPHPIIDVSSFSNGLYLVSIHSGFQAIYKKFVVVH